MTRHIPVLTKEVLRYLNPQPNENFIDGTVGEAGHTLLILEKTKPNGKVLGIDADILQIENARATTVHERKRVTLVHDSYRNLAAIARQIHFSPVHGILIDLGVSSWQLENSGKGFSFQRDETLDMRYDMKNLLTAEIIVNEYTKDRIESILQDYGEERFAKQIAQKVSKQRKIRKIKSTFDLKNIIEQAVPAKFRKEKIHFATRTFQALRVSVNGELDNLEKFLPKAIEVLANNGRLAVISFHSLEDRIVKSFFKNKEKEKIVKILTKKPIISSMQEILINPRARSAKLRAIMKI